jgi:serine/threonine protein kinase
MREFVGETIGHYRVQNLLARGGMAKVYLARHIHTGKSVAIKLLNSSAVEESQYFRFEAETLAKLSHKHILPVIEYGEWESWHYLVTPYISGGTLNQLLKKGPLSCEHAGNLLDQLAQALQFAHDQGLVHCDIKPSNILMRNECFVYLADFGLAKYIDEEIDSTFTNYILGTPEYMAPELAEKDFTHLSDIYSLGIVLYQMVTGRIPFTGNDPATVYAKHAHDLPPLPSSLNAHISEAVEHVILCALEKDPRRRFQTVQEFSHAYWQALQEDRHMQMSTAKQIISGRNAHKAMQTSTYQLQQNGRRSWQVPQEDPHMQLIAATHMDMPVLEPPRVTVYKLRQDRRRPKLVGTILALAVLVSIPIVSGLSAQPHEQPPLAIHVQHNLQPHHTNGTMLSTPLPIPTPTLVQQSITTKSPPKPANNANQNDNLKQSQSFTPNSPSNPENNTPPPTSTVGSEPTNSNGNQNSDGNNSQQNNQNRDFPFQNSDFPFRNKDFPFQNSNFPFQNKDFPFRQGSN